MMKNKNITKKASIILIIFMALVFSSHLSSAVNIGISPAEINFKNVLRNGYSENTVVITSNSEEPVKVKAGARGEIKNWLNFSSRSFKVTKSNPYLLIISVTPPSDIPNGNYSGFITVETEGLGAGIEGHATGIVRTVLDLVVNVEVTDIEILECSAYDFGVQTVEKGDDVVFELKVKNNGNIRFKPKIAIDIWDQEQISIEKQVQYSETEILPTKEEKISIRVPTDDLDVGQYWADVSVLDCFSSTTLTFDVLEPGALKAEGILLGIRVKRFAELGETLPIMAEFKNTGEKEVSAQFRGKITLGKRIIEILESEKYQVPIGELGNFTFFFTPKKTGKYVISGRIFYSGKRTFESSSILEVIKPGFNLSSLILPLIYIILIILIGVIFFKVRKERRLYKQKLKKIRGGT